MTLEVYHLSSRDVKTPSRRRQCLGGCPEAGAEKRAPTACTSGAPPSAHPGRSSGHPPVSPASASSLAGTVSSRQYTHSYTGTLTRAMYTPHTCSAHTPIGGSG